MTASAGHLLEHLKSLADTNIAEQSQRFFKMRPGDYAEGDVFLGIRMPKLRALAAKHVDLNLAECETLLHSKYHEARLLALLILVKQYQRLSCFETEKEKIYRCYLNNTLYINNWDLVDASAYFIVGPHLFHKAPEPLFQLAHSSSLWERRIAIIATLHFIRNQRFDTTLTVCEMLLEDKEDLIHKASGWMLREVGKRCLATEKTFLDQFSHRMPRTMLRYAIEKFSANEKALYMNK